MNAKKIFLPILLSAALLGGCSLTNPTGASPEPSHGATCGTVCGLSQRR